MINNPLNVACYRGRFAPSPTGPLHFGSLVAAVGSYLEAKSHDGEWLVRIEDLDTPRVVTGASSSILHTLESLGMEWDGEVVYQSQRNALYQNALNILAESGLTYPCTCTRKEISDSSLMGIAGAIYPGTCRNAPSSNNPSALRIQTNSEPIFFEDALEGPVKQQLQRESGDFVLRRVDGIFAYQLAVVVDDAEQNITHIVRGADLLDSTPRQIYIQQLLGYPLPSYMHLPIVTNADGKKLSKQTRAAPIDLSKALPQLIAAIRFLGQTPPADLAAGDLPSFWQWALENWQVGKIPQASRSLIHATIHEK